MLTTIETTITAMPTPIVWTLPAAHQPQQTPRR